MSTRTYLSVCVYSRKCLPRTHLCICVYLLKRVCRIHFIAVVIEEPRRGRYSCIAQGASPGLIIGIHLLSPFRGGTSARVLGVVVMLYCIYPLGHLRAWVSAAPTDLNPLLSAFPQGFISGFALISPWALQECRPFRALCRIGCVSPGFHIGLCPHFTLGFAGVSPLQGSLSYWAFGVLCSLNAFWGV